MIKISVIVCTYNRAYLLKNCLRSLVDQLVETSTFEVIIVNNNATDDTEEVAKSFTEKYPNFRYIIEPNQGLSNARNRGYKEAKGEYVAYIDDDARAYTDWVENIHQSRLILEGEGVTIMMNINQTIQTIYLFG